MNRIRPVSQRHTPDIRWEMVEIDTAVASKILHAYRVHPVVARLLSARGLTPENNSTGQFLRPSLQFLQDPFLMCNMECAVERILQAVRRSEKICVYGDYDVDGVSSTALIVSVLELLGVSNCLPVIPHRLNDGYGMNQQRIREIAAQGVSLIITVDTGITAVEEINLANSLGMDVIVTDHHLSGEELPSALAIVNPNVEEYYYEGGRLCGVGVAYKLAYALLKKSDVEKCLAREFLYESLDLVALGTIADVVPLKEENRVLTYHGLKAIQETKRPGLRALMQISGCLGKPVSATTISFTLAPRINAAGRTDDAALALKLLLAKNWNEAEQLARQLNQFNNDRRSIESKILEDSRRMAENLLEKDDSATLVIGGDGWHLGVVGIVASRLAEFFHLPAVVLGISEGTASGSARSIPGYDIHQALHACSCHLETFGGHAAAAGLSLRQETLPEFRQAMNHYARGIFEHSPRSKTIAVDTEVSPGEVDWNLLDQIEKMEPFGEGNPEPVLMMRGLTAKSEPRIVGKGHLKAWMRAGDRIFDLIGFSKGDQAEMMAGSRSVDILFRPKKNHYNGEVRLQLEMLDARPSEPYQ